MFSTSHFAHTALSSRVNLATFHKQNLIECEVVTVQEVAISMKQFAHAQLQGPPERMRKVKWFLRALIFRKNGFSAVLCQLLVLVPMKTIFLFTFFFVDPQVYTNISNIINDF